MTEMPSYEVHENPNFKPYNKLKKQYNPYSSLLPIILSIFTYILIFYVLEVSPLSVFSDTKFLFFISNALIIIIAADYGAFTDKENQDFYREYTATMRIDTRGKPRHEISGYEASLTEETKNREKQDKDTVEQYLHHKEEEEVHEKTVRIPSENQQRDLAIEKYEPTTEKNVETYIARKLPKPYGRSKSDKLRRKIKHRPTSYDRSNSDSSKWMVVHEEKKEKAEETHEVEEKWENVREESEEFSKMSNEELNKRVEEFIQRFNRDIKRQSFV